MYMSTVFGMDADSFKMVDAPLHKKQNQFQLGQVALVELMQYQAGLTFTMNTASLQGHWVDSHGKYYDFTGTIDPICPIKDKLIQGTCDQGVPFTLPAVSFLDESTKIYWRKPPDEVVEKWLSELEGEDHIRSMKRAERFMEEYLESCDFHLDPQDIILILDGNGENRRGMEKALEKAEIPKSQWPQIITMEINPEVALVNKLMFGDCIVFTGADAGFCSKSLLANKMKGVPIEHLIEKPNDLLTNEMKKRVKGFYGDYCGGPTGNQKVEKCKEAQSRVMAELINCLVFGITISHRKHPHEFMEYISVPDGFKEFACFTDNPRVKCKMFSKLQAQRVQKAQVEMEIEDLQSGTRAKKRKFDCDENGGVQQRKVTHLQRFIDRGGTKEQYAEKQINAKKKREHDKEAIEKYPVILEDMAILCEEREKTNQELDKVRKALKVAQEQINSLQALGRCFKIPEVEMDAIINTKPL
jgi:hypothetical protein